MKVNVINRFVDAETGAVHLPGSEVDLPKERLDRLERKRCVQRKKQPEPPRRKPAITSHEPE